MNTFLSWLSRKIDYPIIAPEIIQISLTYRCNLRCKMCSIVDLLPRKEELSTGQIFHIIEEAADYTVRKVVLTGGEPFLREDIFEICNYSHKKGLQNIITTNGMSIGSELADRIINSKINHIHFSIDGLGHTHDFFRGRGAFKKAIKAIKILMEKRNNNGSLSIGIACTVMNRNVKELFKLVKLADELGADVINFQPLASDNTNFFDRRLSPFWLEKEDVAILKDELAKLRKYRPKHITICEEPRLELLLKYYQRQLTQKDWICFGGFKTVFICYAKNEPLIYSCHGICGNLDKISLKRAWESKEAYKLRIHSKNCKNLCMQSCYSQETAQNLPNLIRFYNKK
ncbi:radical SAM protein [Patescibacteria group bacterium]|nr:radical SAM protein [Patescibacteria group bacterium]